MTITDVAAYERVGVRTAQRYITAGYKGHKLTAVKSCNEWSIRPEDYEAWRVACGFQPKPVKAKPVKPQVPASAPPDGVHPAPTSPTIGPTGRTYPPYPMAADPVHGVLTNAPHERSSNWPHPLAVRDYTEAEARKLLQRFRGTTHDDED